MSPSRPFIMRPVATSLLMFAIVLTGAVAYKQLAVSALPQVDLTLPCGVFILTEEEEPTTKDTKDTKKRRRK